jgi:hypothetical protein
MKLKIGILCVILGMAACKNNENKEVQNLKEQHARDSVTINSNRGKDSVIANYVNAIGEIQDNLDSLKQKEKILTMGGGEKGRSKESIIADIRSIDNAIIENNKKINQLQSHIRKMQSQDATFRKTIARLNREIAKKDSEVTYYQSLLNKSNDSIVAITHRFNDTINEIKNQRAKYSELNTAYNTVYYTVGTMKQLKEKGVISKSGGLLGIGRTSSLNSNANNSAFTKGDMTKISTIDLNGKLSKMVTNHPGSSYKINALDKKHDQLEITDQKAFWSESKYLVVMVK